MINIICLKWGDKYDHEWVNRLYLMVKNRCSVPFNFYCVTENPHKLHEEVNVIALPLQYELETFWWKLWLFSEEFPLKGKNLFFDLDTVIQNDIKDLCEYNPKDKICILEAKWRENIRKLDPDKSATNSSVMLWDSKYNNAVWSKFILDSDKYMLTYPGNDDFMESVTEGNIGKLPHKWFYCRAWGYDDTDPDQESRRTDPYIDAWNINWPLYNMPERMICLFNGVDYREGMDMRIWEGFSHYYENLK